MKNFAKFVAMVIVAVSATVASAADLEFHGYARVGIGLNSEGGNQVSFMLNEDGKTKFRLGNEADWVLEPGFTMSFTKLDDKSAWGVHMLPATYRRFQDDAGSTNNNADGGLNTSFKEFYFYGQNVPQLGGGEIWVGRRYFGRVYLGAINDSFLEAQDGVGAGVYNIPVGPAKLNFDIAAPDTLSTNASATDVRLSLGANVAGIPTINKDSPLGATARIYWSRQNKTITDKRETGYSLSAKWDISLGTPGTITVAGRYDKNAYTDQQDNGGQGVQKIELDGVYGVNIASIRTNVDVLLAYLTHKSVKGTSDAVVANDDTTTIFLGGFRTDTQISGPFRFLLEFGYDQAKTKAPPGGSGDPAFKTHTLWKLTPCFAISGGNDPWSRPTFRLFYTFAGWNKDGAASVAAAWKDNGVAQAFGDKTSGGVLGLQAEGWW